VLSLPDRLPLALRLYQFATRTATPLAPRLLAARLQRRKEHPGRLAERRGEASLRRPRGSLIWVHAASVGEMLAVVPLIECIREQNFAVLVTSGTVSSATLAEQRLPPGAIHQFVPLDMPQFVARFLNHWRPDLALCVESDLWPNLILSCSERKIPLILLNGRVSERSFMRWRLIPGAISALLNRFDLCLVQSPSNAQRFSRLGAPRISSTGNLKLDAPAPLLRADWIARSHRRRIHAPRRGGGHARRASTAAGKMSDAADSDRAASSGARGKHCRKC
jgi:3-deoxy-D-manno-octulosonic-acid transferase